VNAIIILFIIGILLVAVEILVPGGLLGVLGGGALLAGVVTSFARFGMTGGMIATILAVVIGGITLYLEFVFLPKTKLARALSMSETVTGRSQPEIANRLAIIGHEAVAVTTLAPTGYVEVDGRRYEAFCQSGMAGAGARLRVVEVETFRLVVTQIKPNS
jgi:membrane-bound serine protease (ClpP class)